MSNAIPRSGYDLVAKILETHPDDAIETMLKYSKRGECDWLEFKAGMTLRPEDVEKENRPDDLYWDYVLSIVAMANTRGGAFVIGVNDRTHEPVPLQSCDPRHVFGKRGKEAYLREEIVDKFDLPNRKWTTKDGTVWGLPTSIVPFIDARIIPYRESEAAVILVSPDKPGEELFVSRRIRGGDEYEDLPIRKKGEVGRVKRLTKRTDCDAYVSSRKVELGEFGVWWDELDAEHQAAQADEKLDNAIRVYHAKFEEESKKRRLAFRLQAFIPLEAETDEQNEEEPGEDELEDPKAYSVFNEDEESWLGSGNVDEIGIKLDSKTTNGLDAESDSDEPEECDDPVEADDEYQNRTIRIGLSELLEQKTQLVLVGEPGAGKTTSLAHFVVKESKQERRRPHLFAFISLGRWGVDGGSVRDLLEKCCGLSQAQIDTLLEQKRIHLILDALNECPDQFRDAAIKNIHHFLKKHQDIPFVLSTRKAKGIRILRGVPMFEVQAMDKERQRFFLVRYLRDENAADKILDSLTKQPGGESIAQNPMLLRMVVDVVRVQGDLPTGRATLYRRWLENWYDREEQKAKNAQAPLPWSQEESIRLFSHLAFAGRIAGYRDIPVGLARRALDNVDDAFLDRLCQGPLLEIDKGVVHFRHETFQEYLCAEWLLSEPTALDALSEKDYDTWGMPIAYAAELSLPGKLPKELSDAVWEMNPWMAALVASSSLRKTTATDSFSSEMILADSLFRKKDLLSEDLREAFRTEISNGSLFKHTDAPLSYLVLCSEKTRQEWLYLECAFVLNMPPFVSNQFTHRHDWETRKEHQAKIHNLIALSTDSMVHHVLHFFPKVSLVSVFSGWRWFFQDSSTQARIQALSKLTSTFAPLPIEALSIIPGRVTMRSEKSRLFTTLFGENYLQDALLSISSNPCLWCRSGIIPLLEDAKWIGFSVHTAARSIVSELIHTWERAAAVPPSTGGTSFRSLLDESDIRILLPNLSSFGKAVLKKLSSSSFERFEPFFKGMPKAGNLEFRESDLTDDNKRRDVLTIFYNQDFTMSVSSIVDRKTGNVVTNKFWPGGCCIIFKNENFPDGLKYVVYSKRQMQVKGRHLSIGSRWRVQVDVKWKKSKYVFLPTPLSFIPSTPCELYRRSDLSDPDKRQHIEAKLKNGRWKMKVAFLSEDRGFLFFKHPSFPDNVYCPARFTKYQDSFEVGQSWNVFVGIKQNKKDGSFGFVAQSVEPAETNPVDISQSKKQEPGNNPEISSKNTRFSKGFPKGFSPMSIPSAIHIYIDEAWPGFQDHSKKDTGVITGVVWMGSAPNENILPFVETHLRANGGQQLNALLRCDKAFPFAFPIRFPEAFEPDSEKYLELLSESMVVLLGWILPRPTHRTKVFIHAEHYGAFTDGADETNSFRALLAGATMTLDAERLSRWSIEKVEWQGKNFGYIPYGDLVAYLFAETPDAKRMAREFQVDRWPGCVPFSAELLPALCDLDSADPAGAAGALFRLSGLCGESMLFRHSLRSFLDSAKENPKLRDAVLDRLCDEFERKDRDLRKLGRIADAFFAAFPDEAFEDRPKPRFLRLLASLQQANHDGNPAAVDEAFRPYDGLRAEMAKRDFELSLYADLNVAVHFNDRFEFEKAESLLRQCREAPSFPFLSVRDRGRLLSSLGQSAALLGRHAEADDLFHEALKVFSELGGELEEESDQTRVYRAFAALDALNGETPMKVADALMVSIDEAVLRPKAIIDHPFREHLLAKTLWYAQDSAIGPEWIRGYLSTAETWTSSPQHPWELILLYRGLLAWKADQELANRCFDEWDEWFRTVPHGGTLSLIRGFGLVAMHRLCGRELDGATLESLLRPVAEALPATAPTIGSLLRIGEDDSPDSLAELWSLLPFNYK